MYAEFLDLGDAVPSGLDAHLVNVSHELLQWLDGPLILGEIPNQQPDSAGGGIAFSFAPLWTSPYYPSGCANLYEVADPLEDGGPLIGVPDSGHVDLSVDAVFQSWFAHSSPSTAFGGLYDIAGFLQSFSDSCPVS